MKRTLHLSRESLGSLGDDDLRGVVGGQYSGGNLTCIKDCVDALSWLLTCHCSLVC